MAYDAVANNKLQNICHQYKKSQMKNRRTMIYAIIIGKFRSRQAMHRLKFTTKE